MSFLSFFDLINYFFAAKLMVITGENNNNFTIMAYFLKKTTVKGRVYLSICESFYDKAKKATAHRTFKSLGSLESLLAQGIPDPISHFKLHAQALNNERKIVKTKTISKHSPHLHLGYFPLKSLIEKLEIKKYVDFFKLTTSFEFDLFELLSSLVYARAVHPCSKHKTFHDVLPQLNLACKFSYDQLLDGLYFLGQNYEKFIEIFTAGTKKHFGIDTSKTYFDATNFYFEIDREDDFRRKGPGKENRKDPIVSLGLLLDSNQIPIGMQMFPGNQSEKPILRNIVADLKKRNNIKGRTIHIADKGLNCIENIAFSKTNGDGYLFSKSVRMLPANEKAWFLNNNDWQDIRDSQGALHYRFKSSIDTYTYTFTVNGKKTKIDFLEKRLLTYSPSLASKKRYEINRMVEKARGLTHSQAKRKDYGESSKYVTFSDEKGNKATVSINQEAIDKDLQFAGYNLLVTSETKMADQEIYDTYHNLWRIEESFRVMKSDLDARPVYVQLEETIKGHFLICYLTVLLERLMQFKVLKNKYSTSHIIKFIRNFTVTKLERDYINTSTDNDFIKDMVERLNLPLRNFHLTQRDVDSILGLK